MMATSRFIITPATYIPSLRHKKQVFMYCLYHIKVCVKIISAHVELLLTFRHVQL